MIDNMPATAGGSTQCTGSYLGCGVVDNFLRSQVTFVTH